MKKKFLVEVEKYYTQKVTYEVEASSESDAYGEALKPNPMVFSLEAIMPSSLFKVGKVITRTEFACRNCPNSYANEGSLVNHLNDTGHRSALLVS